MTRAFLAASLLVLLVAVAPSGVAPGSACLGCFHADTSLGGLYGYAEPIHPETREWQAFADLWTFQSLDLDLAGGSVAATVGNGPGATAHATTCNVKGPNDGPPTFYGPGGKATLSGTL